MKDAVWSASEKCCIVRKVKNRCHSVSIQYVCIYTTQLHRHMRGVFMRFTDLKSETLNLRVSRKFKQALKKAAEHEQRSMVNML